MLPRPLHAHWLCLFLAVLGTHTAVVPVHAEQSAGGTAAQALATDQPISLQEAIKIAERNHASVTVARDSLEAAKQRVRQARAGILPNVVASVGYSGMGSSPGGTRYDMGLQPRVAVDYTLWDGGLTKASVRQATAGVDSSEAGLTATRNDLAFTVAANYLAQLRAERILALRKAQEELAQQQLERIETRISVGSAAEADRALQLSELRNRQVERIQAENEVKVAANTLRNSMGLPVGPPLRLIEPAQADTALPSVDVLRQRAERQRPEVVQAQARVRSAEAALAIAELQRHPRLNASAGITSTPEREGQRAVWDLGMTVSMPIWDAGSSRAKELEARAELRSALAQLEQIRKDVAAEVEEAYLNFVNAQERLQAAQAAVEAAKVNLDATTARYERGVAGVSVVDLFASQVQYSTANTNAIQALYDVHLARVQLERALGGPVAGSVQGTQE